MKEIKGDLFKPETYKIQVPPTLTTVQKLYNYFMTEFEKSLKKNSKTVIIGNLSPDETLRTRTSQKNSLDGA